MDTSGVDPTWAPGETIRADRAETTAPGRPLPDLSVDLRQLQLPPSAGAASGADLEVRGLIGEGGMGRVLLVRQHSLSREVAVKTSKLEANDSARAAILLEGEVTGSLEHPSIVPVHALGLDRSGHPAIVMKRIEGVSWDVLLADPRHANWEGWEGSAEDRLPGHLQILVQVCNALHFAHSRGVVHRDLKPHNVLIGRFGDVYVADWGVATRVGTRSTHLCGTPAYLAPEMVSGEAVDERTDVYLLGATLHVVLTGTPRHAGPSVTESLLQARTSPPARYGPDVPAELAALANGACSLDPKARPASARDFRDALTRYVKHRDARALADQATRRAIEVEPLLALDAPGDEVRAHIERLLSEARFGLTQSLAQWPENDAARVALERIEKLVESRSRRLHALEADAREVDPRRGVWWRTVGMGLTTLIALAAAILAFALKPEATPQAVLAFPLVVLVVMLLGAVLLRRQLFGTRLNRQVYVLVIIGVVFMTVGRLVGLVEPAEPWVHMSRDCFAISATTFAAAVFLRWVWPMAVVYLVAGVWCMVDRERSIPVFAWVTVLSLTLATWISWRQGQTGATTDAMRR